MSFCAKCRAQLSESAIFCSNCGEPVAVADLPPQPTAQAQPEPSQPWQPPQPEPAPLLMQSQPESPQSIAQSQPVPAPPLTQPQPVMSPQQWQQPQPGMSPQQWQQSQPGMSSQQWQQPQPGMSPQQWQQPQPGMPQQQWQQSQPGMSPQQWQQPQPGMPQQQWQQSQPGMSPQQWQQPQSGMSQPPQWGQQQPNYPQQGYPGYNQTPIQDFSNPAVDCQANKVYGVISYLGPLFLITLLSAPKNSQYSKFHANQGLVLCLFGVGLYIVVTILAQIMISLWMPDYYSQRALMQALGNYGRPGVLVAVSVLWYLANIFTLVMVIMGIVNATKPELKPLPLIGGFRIIK